MDPKLEPAADAASQLPGFLPGIRQQCHTQILSPPLRSGGPAGFGQPEGLMMPGEYLGTHPDLGAGPWPREM